MDNNQIKQFGSKVKEQISDVSKIKEEPKFDLLLEEEKNDYESFKLLSERMEKEEKGTKFFEAIRESLGEASELLNPESGVSPLTIEAKMTELIEVVQTYIEKSLKRTETTETPVSRVRLARDVEKVAFGRKMLVESRRKQALSLFYNSDYPEFISSIKKKRSFSQASICEYFDNKDYSSLNEEEVINELEMMLVLFTMYRIVKEDESIKDILDKINKSAGNAAKRLIVANKEIVFGTLMKLMAMVAISYIEELDTCIQLAPVDATENEKKDYTVFLSKYTKVGFYMASVIDFCNYIQEDIGKEEFSKMREELIEDDEEIEDYDRIRGIVMHSIELRNKKVEINDSKLKYYDDFILEDLRSKIAAGFMGNN